jgi:hypothetical protein
MIHKSRTTRLTASVALAAAALLATSAPALATEPATPALQSTDVSPASITAGDQALQTVRLTAPAPAGGTRVQLISTGVGDRAYDYSTGREVTVPAGAQSVSFPVRFDANAETTTVNVHAQLGESGADTKVTVTPPDWRQQTVERIDVDRPGDARSVVSGGNVTGTVTLSSPAKVGGTSVDLREGHQSGRPDGPTLQLPPYTVVPAGATKGTFTAYIPHQRIGITDVGADIGHPAQWAAMLIVPKSYTVGAVRQVRPGSEQNLGAVGLGDLWHPFGAVIELRSDNPAVKVPSKIEIPANEVGRTFPISVDASVPVGTKAKISAKWVLSPAGTVTTDVTVGS